MLSTIESGQRERESWKKNVGRLLKPDHQDERMNLELHTDGRELVATESSSDASGTRLLPIGFASGCFLSGLQTADRECELADGERELAVMRTGS
ncbi:hypothetical protein F2Q68_00032335 [Brassica cretica]|uniref:Uncharacterized protein n=1 Tax=Brassica cretica TaxID=69181 RepID=A0A8S9GII8_BRACR|nr:hypothetical protein F2Q68_00032335 [Brassica cretica]